MKVKHELVKFTFCGDVHSFYIRKVKMFWWWPFWHIVMDGNAPAMFDLIDGEYIRRL